MQQRIALGVFLVLSLWAARWDCLVGRRDLISLAVVWGVVIWIFGVTQNQILPGGAHWLFEAGRLVAGVIAIALGTVLGNAVANTRVAMRSSVS